jgi:hypothetical protein
MLQFCLGEPAGIAYVKSALKSIHSLVQGPCYTAKARVLSLQQFQFASRLVKAAGLPGWVLFVDELELMGCYTRLQRAKSYMEVARLLGRDASFSCPGLKCVFAITDDFEAAVIDGKGDKVEVPRLLEQRSAYVSETISLDLAVKGMRCIADEGIALQTVQHAELQDLYARVKALHAAAYQWDPPDVRWPEILHSTRMRQFVKSWITEWDMKRLYPFEDIELEQLEVTTNYNENGDEEPESGADDNDVIDEILAQVLPDLK